MGNKGVWVTKGNQTPVTGEAMGWDGMGWGQAERKGSGTGQDDAANYSAIDPH